MTADQKPHKLLFHIGDHKAGSTTIQNAFARKEVVLENGSILYPARLSHNYLVGHFKTYAEEGHVLPGRPGHPGLGGIAERMVAESPDFTVISGEEFEGSDPGTVQQGLNDLWLPHTTDYSVICYLRPHAARILSSFSETTKIGIFSGNVERYFERSLASKRFFYSPRIAKWSDLFGTHFSLRPMVRSELAGGSLLQDFVETGFGPEAKIRIETQTPANESLCLEDLLVLKLVQDRIKGRDRKLRSAMGWEMAPAFSAIARTGKPGTKLMLHKSLAERIRTSYLEDAQEIDTRFFGGKDIMRAELTRAVDEALPVEQSFDPVDYFNEEALRGIRMLAEQIDRMLDHESGPWSEFLWQRRTKSFLVDQTDAAENKAKRPRKNAEGPKKTAGRPRKKLGQRRMAGKGKQPSE